MVSPAPRIVVFPFVFLVRLHRLWQEELLVPVVQPSLAPVPLGQSVARQASARLPQSDFPGVSLHS